MTPTLKILLPTLVVVALAAAYFAPEDDIFGVEVKRHKIDLAEGCDNEQHPRTCVCKSADACANVSWDFKMEIPD